MISPRSIPPHHATRRSDPLTLLLIAAAIVLFVPLLAHALLGSYTRYIADDWCTSATVLSDGLIQAQYTWYVNWSGRYSFTFAVSLAELIGIKLVPLLPALTLGIWIIAAAWTVYQFRDWGFQSHASLVSLLIANLLLFSILDSIPNVHQSLYWQTGMLTYIAPLILFTWMIGIFMYNLRRETNQRLTGSALLLGILAFLAGGFSEMYVAMQTTAFFTAIVVTHILRQEDRKRAQTPLLIAGFVGSIISMAVVFFAPGNEIRQALTPESPGLLKIISLSLFYGLKFIGKSVLLSPIPTVLSLFIPALVTFAFHPGERRLGERKLRENRIRSYLLLLFSPIVGYLLIAFSMAPSVYGVSAFPEDRALTIPQFVLTITIIFWGALCGAALKRYGVEIEKIRRWIAVIVCSVVVVLLVLGPLLSARENFVRAPTLRAYAERWDNRDHEIRDAIEGGTKHLVVSALGFTGGLADIKGDPDYWVNRCFASYYGLESIIAK
jgi:hypothetical protein